MENIITLLKKLIKEIKVDAREMVKQDMQTRLSETLQYETFLDDPNSKLGRIARWVIIFLIFASIGLLIFESIGDNATKYAIWIFVIDGFISTIFAIEYFYRRWYARSKLRFVIQPMNVIDLLAWIPFYIELLLQGLIDISMLKVLRLLRVFRIFKMFRYFKIINKIWYGIRQYAVEYAIGFFAVFVVIVIASVLMYYIEWSVNEWFKDIPSAIRWAIVTATTVWYGDVYPVTLWWKIIGAIVILIWPTVIAMVSSITVLVFMEVATAHKMEKQMLEKSRKCPRCGNEKNDQDANYCKICGQRLDDKMG